VVGGYLVGTPVPRVPLEAVLLSCAWFIAATKIFQAKPEFHAESIKTVKIGNGSILHFF
jgi:hypothetical protein